jgi:hypothetical protein
MRKLYWHVHAILAMFLIVAAPDPTARANEVWFNPRPPSTAWTGTVDWFDLFPNDAPWTKAASIVNVFWIEPYTVEHATDTQLASVADGIRRRKFDVAIPLQAIAQKPQDQCGHKEGYAPPGVNARVAARLKKFGIIVKYAAFDGPLWSGHFFEGPQGCRLPIAELVDRVAAVADEILAVYPNAIVGDIEPVPSVTQQPDWQAQLRAFKSGVENRLKTPLSFMQLDLNWDDPGWKTGAREAAPLVRSLGMRLGVYYKGTALDNDDAAWIAHAEADFTELETGLRIVPDQAIFASWEKFPTRALPETAPDTYTHLIDVYRLPLPQIEATEAAGSMSGRLRDASGDPIAGAEVAVSLGGVNLDRPLAVRTLSGIVPDNAQTAILGVRVNTECLCAGPNDLFLGRIEFADGEADGQSDSLDVLTRPAGQGVTKSAATVDGTIVAHILTTNQGAFLANSAPFAVRPGAPFTLRVPIETAKGEGMFGRITVIWLDADGKGIKRATLAVVSDFRRVGVARTDVAGGFKFALPPSWRGDKPAIRIEFPGNTATRPAVLDLH